MLRRTFLFATACAIASPAFAAGEQPADIVTLIYKVSAGKKGDYSGASAFTDKGIRAKYFSKSLVAAIVKMDRKSAATNEPILDFDPVTSSQDPSVKRLKITSESQTADKAVVTATFYSFDSKTPTVVRYLFNLEGDSWRIDDMTGGEVKDSWKLREVINQ